MDTGWENVRGRMLALRALEKALRDMRRGDGFLYGNAGSGAIWTAVLDEHLRESIGEEYETLRDREAPLIHGLLHVRNGISHAASVTTQDAGLTVPFVIPVVIPAAAWLPLEEVHRRWTPNGLNGARVKHRIAMYEQHLAGRDPAETLRTVHDFFAALEAADWQPNEVR
ncbi:hypothetical protein ACIPEQ_13425 [Curtobacterium sp. NPDC087080]|uniref:hypothetical protein n=1 Tax=Curtobacterium sp. NPDC087080 TaxID=3363965 RepID=UPI003822AEF3